MNKDIDKVEHLFDKLHEISTIRFVVDVECEQDIDEKAILARAATLVPESALYFDDNVDKVEEYFSITYSDDVQRDALNSMTYSSFPIECFYNKNKISIVLDHTFSDGKSGVVFGHNLLSNHNDLTFGKKDFKSVYRAFPDKYRGLSGAVFYLKSLLIQLSAAFIEGFTKHPEALKTKAEYTGATVQHHIFDESETAQLINRTHENEGTITTLLGAAQTMATKKILFNNKDIPIGLHFTVDLRNRLNSKPNYNILAFFISVIVAAEKFSSDVTVDELSVRFKRRLVSKMRLGMHYAVYKMMPPMAILPLGGLRFLQSMSAKTSLMSNIGVVEKALEKKDENIKSIRFWVPPSPQQTFAISASTYNKRLHLSMLSFNERLANELSEAVFEQTISYLKQPDCEVEAK